MEAQKASMTKMKSFVKNDQLLVTLIFVLLVAFNFNKAVHIDDAFHLQVANYLIDNPTEPLSGKVLWDNQEKEIYHFNQPVLFFYYIALLISIFGENIPLLHFATSIFLIPVLIYFCKINDIIGGANKRLLLVVFGFSYPLLVNQNIMVDLPLLSLLIGSVYHFLKGLKNNRPYNFLLSSIILSAGIMVKYTILPVLILLPLILVYKKQFKVIFFYLIPIITIGAWSFWNFNEIGKTHIGGRESQINNAYYIFGYVSCLGSMSLFAPILIFNQLNNRLKNISTWLYSLVLLSIPIAALSIFITNSHNSLNLNYLFIGVGSILIVTLVYFSIKEFFKKKFILSESIVLVGIAFSISLFLIMFAPFIASRHLLLVLPFFILALNKYVPFKLDSHGSVLIGIYVLINVWIGIGDYSNAKFFKEKALEIASQTNRKTFSAGYWGWQYYSKKYGMVNYHWGVHRIKEGHFMTFPLSSPRQYITPEIQLDTTKYIIGKPKIWSVLIGKNYESLYWSDHQSAAWSIGNFPTDTIVLAKVIDGLNLEDMKNRIKDNKEWIDQIKTNSETKQLNFDSLLIKNAKWLYNNSEH